MMAVIALVVTAMAGALGVGSMEHKVGGHSAAEVFSNAGVAELAKAACVGNGDQIARLAKTGVDVNSRATRDKADDISPLMWAISCRSLAGFEALLKAGANPNQPVGKFNITPTYAVAREENPDFLRLALQYGGNPSALSGKDTALVSAFGLGQIDGKWQNYYLLLNAGADINAADGLGLADYAAAVGRPDKAVELLERGYNYNLEGLAEAIYSSALADAPSDPQYKYLTIAARMLKERGVNTEEIKRKIDAKNKAIGAGVVQNYSFESADN